MEKVASKCGVLDLSYNFEEMNRGQVLLQGIGGQGGWWAWSPGWLSWSPAAIPPTTKPQSTTSTAPQSTTTSQVKTTSVMILTKRLCHIPSNHIATSKQWISSEEHRWQRKAQRGFKHLTKGVILNLFNVLLDNGAADLDHEEDVNYIFLTCPHPSFWCVQFVSKILQSWLDSIAVSLCGNMTVETGEILFNIKDSIRT